MTTVIYHSADFDGIFCREIAKKFLVGNDIRYIGWNFGDPLISTYTSDKVYILDLSPECLANFKDNGDGIIWIDHHKTSIESYPSRLHGYRIDGVAACRLTWQWFNKVEDSKTPCKEDYINRLVTEPLAVQMAGEYDVWDKRNPQVDVFQTGLRGIKKLDWTKLLDTDMNGYSYCQYVLSVGNTIQDYKNNQDSILMKSRAFNLEFEGLKFLALNCPLVNSLTFTSGLLPEHDAYLSFQYNGKKGGWTVSLYGCKNKPELDLSVIATKYGGGGHKQACGFTCKELPFKLP